MWTTNLLYAIVVLHSDYYTYYRYVTTVQQTSDEETQTPGKMTGI